MAAVSKAPQTEPACWGGEGLGKLSESEASCPRLKFQHQVCGSSVQSVFDRQSPALGLVWSFAQISFGVGEEKSLSAHAFARR